MANFTEDFTGTAGELSTGYSTLHSGAISRDGAGLGTGTGSEERGVLRTNETYGNDQKVTWTKLSTTGSVDGGVLRGSGSGTTYNGYRGYVYSVVNWEIDRVDSGTSTSLTAGTAGVEHAVNDVFEFKVVGTVLTLTRTRSGTPTVLATYDTTSDGTKYSSGSPGFYMYNTPSVDNVIFEDIGGSSYTITAASGTYSLSGQATGVLFNAILPAVQGSYSLTGQTTNLSYTAAVVLTAEYGTYFIVGSDALIDHSMNAEQGTYNLSGQITTLTYTQLNNFSLTADQGTYTLSGQTQGLLFNRNIPIVSGIYTVTGQAIGLLWSGASTSDGYIVKSVNISRMRIGF